jgi:hypothetical protein
MPPMTAMDSGPDSSTPVPMPSAGTSMAKMIVSDVIRIGRSRRGQASASAWSTPWPSARSWLVRSTSRIEFLATRPISRIRPTME